MQCIQDWILEQKKDINGKTGEIVIESSLVNTNVQMLIFWF